jgi:hypothetical protein|nr:MAG TPA: hypothetical protein [Caudoviricetes sp.]
MELLIILRREIVKMRFAKFSLSLVIGLIILVSFIIAMVKVFAVPILVIAIAVVAFIIVRKHNIKEEE